jgi:GntR family transcriptional regulator, carbon starvation induced regulator
MKRSIVPVQELQPGGSDSPRTVAEAIYHRLREDIVWNRLPPGAALRSDELRDAYGVGISPLREALSKLVAERLVTTVGQKGFRVAPLTAEGVMDIMETRLVLEREALTRSLRNGDIAWETEVVASYHGLSRVAIPRGPGDDAQLWARHHRRFHMSLLAACGSRWMLDLAALLFDQAARHRAVRALLVPRPKLNRDAAGEHRKIFEAVLARDAKAAVSALDSHYRTTAEHVVAALRHVPKIKSKDSGRILDRRGRKRLA